MPLANPSMTLVVVAEESDDVSDLGETLAALMPEHPARAVLVRLRGAGQRELSARVYSQCWMPFGQRRQICCEQVEITAADAALADLPPLLLPLAVADLPIILWCRSRRLPAMAEFQHLAEMATRVIVDSGAWADPGAALEWVAQAVARPAPLIGGLAWTHLTRWREMLSQIFENEENLARLSGAVKLRVADSSAVTTRALYCAAWVKDGLESAGARVAVSIAKGAEPFLELNCGGFTVRLEGGERRLITTVDGVSQCTNLPAPTDYLLLREELTIMRRDPVFERTVASASRLAYATE